MINLQDYIKQSALFKTFEIEDLMLVQYKCLVDDHQADIWAHHDYFAYVLGGEKKWVTPAGSYRIGPGEALYVRKGATTVYQYFDHPFFVIFIFLKDSFIRNVLRKHPGIAIQKIRQYLDNDSLVLLEQNQVLTSYFHSLEAFFAHNVPVREAVITLKIEELILDILIQPGNESIKNHFYNLIDRRKSNLSELMNANYLKNLSLSAFARICDRSLSSFHRDFRKEFGTSPGKWLLEKRLQHSRFLLQTTNSRIGEVLYESGFTNRSHFNKAFKNRFGISPQECRLIPQL